MDLYQYPDVATNASEFFCVPLQTNFERYSYPFLLITLFSTWQESMFASLHSVHSKCTKRTNNNPDSNFNLQKTLHCKSANLQQVQHEKAASSWQVCSKLMQAPKSPWWLMRFRSVLPQFCCKLALQVSDHLWFR